MATKLPDNRIRPVISITLDQGILDVIDREAEKLGIPRSRLIENCLAMAVDDLKLLRRLGLIDALRVIQGFQERVKAELFAATR